MTEEKKVKLNTIHWISGGISGCVAKSCVAPLDRVKILFQTRNTHYIKDYKSFSILRTLTEIVKQEGFFRLWKGNTATLARIFPYSSIQWLSYEYYKKTLMPETSFSKSKPHPLMHLLCGSLAGCTATLFTYPLDLVRARMASQVHDRVYKNVFHALSLMLKQEGIKSWFKGWKPTIQGIIPYAGVNFSTFETLKHYAPKDNNGDLTVTWKLICGGIAGPTGQTISYPWDVVRRRQQTWGFAPGTVDLGTQGTMKTFSTIIKSEGFFALWRGISINYVKATPTSAIAFTTYETISTFLKNRS